MKVHFPSLVENEILKEDGSVIKRFGLAWGDALATNTENFSKFKKSIVSLLSLGPLKKWQFFLVRLWLGDRSGTVLYLECCSDVVA